MLCRDSGLPTTARNTTGTSGNVSGKPAAREESSLSIFENSENQASYCGMVPDETKKTMGPEKEVVTEPQNSSKAILCFQRGAGVFDHTSRTYSHGGVLGDPRFVSEMHLGKFPDYGISKLESQLQD